jgi:heptosyltransferase I
MRVGIVRLTSLGDVVHTLPVAHALRQHHGAAHIAWIVEEREQALVQDNPAVDTVVVGPTRRWRRALRTPQGAVQVWREWVNLHRQLRALSLDVVIDVQGLFKSAHFTLLTHAQTRIGFDRRHARDPLSALLSTHRVSPPATAAHIVEQNLSLLQPLGISHPEIAFPLPVVPDSEAWAEQCLRAHGLTDGQRIVAVLPASRRPTKLWPPAHFRRLVERLGQTAALRILVLGGPAETALLESIGRGLDGSPISIADRSISDLVALLRRVTVAVGNDTGPVHIAAALGVPTIGLYGPTRSERNGPYGARARALQSPTGRMADISVDDVFRAVVEALD